MVDSRISIEEEAAVKTLLAEAWELFEGSDQRSTDGYKLHRAEHLQCQFPSIRFVLERHGGAKFGSTRAELHHWEVDLNTLQAGSPRSDGAN
jgi:hypothetical protein